MTLSTPSGPLAVSHLRRALVPAFALCALTLAVQAQGPPAGYYDSVDSTDPAALRATLHAVIDDHLRYPYTSGSTDTWNVLNDAQEDPTDSGRIIDVYRNQSIVKISGGTGPYNREHTWPKSYGFPDDNSQNYPYTDCHLLRLCDPGYNSARENKPFRFAPGGSEYTTAATNGQGGGCCTYAGNSNWTSGSFTQGAWEVWIGRRGDIARAMFYADVRYEGGTHNGTGATEPDLILTDIEALIDASNTGNNELVAYMGMLAVLLQWHAADPVDDWERNRNDVIFSYQGNRNPFVDNPDWVDCIFSSNCDPGAPPPPVAYCTGKLNSQFCLPAVGFSGTPSVSDPTPFLITASMVINNKTGLLFYGYGTTSTPFQGGTLCVAPPLRRTGVQFGGGNPPPEDCSGAFTFDFNALIQSGADPFLVAGFEAYAQYWYRDPAVPDPSKAGLTDGLHVTIGG